MSDNRHVPTRAIQAAMKGREDEILDRLKIDWKSGQPHIPCPYPAHDDDNPSWRWDDEKTRAFYTCIDGSHSIFDVVGVRAWRATNAMIAPRARLLDKPVDAFRETERRTLLGWGA